MPDLAQLQATLAARRDRYNQRVGQRDALLAQLQVTEDEIARLKQETDLNEQIRYLLQKASELARESARKVLEDTVTSALQYIFGPEYRFVIELEQRSGRTEAHFYVESPAPDGSGMMRLPPEEARGGGVVDVVGLALRLAVLRLHQDPKVADVLILDEPCKMLSESFSGLAADFLKWCSDHFGIQVIMVTHNEDLASAADRSFLVQQQRGTSRIVAATPASAFNSTGE